MSDDPKQDLETIIGLLQEAGFRAQRSDDGSFVRSGAAGFKFLIFPKPRSLQFRCGLEVGDHRAFGDAQVNAFNRDYRFSKMYLDDDRDIVLEADHVIGLDRPTVQDDFTYIMGLWEGSLGLMRQAVEQASDQADAPAETPSTT